MESAARTAYLSRWYVVRAHTFAVWVLLKACRAYFSLKIYIYTQEDFK